MRSLQKTRRAPASRTAVPREVRYYNVMMFRSPFSAIAFCRQIAEALTGKAGKAGRMVAGGAQRPMLWIAPTALGDGSCYVYASDGALDVARTVGLDASVVGYSLDTELPESKCLFFGDAVVDASIDRKSRSAALLALCLAATAKHQRSHPGNPQAPGSASADWPEVF